MPALWDHSVAVSTLAQRIANCEGCPKAVLEECFTAGLLHDLGKVVLLAELPQDYLKICTTPQKDGTDPERELLGCTHAEVGAYLMSIWGLPFPLFHAVAYHHHPNETAETSFSPLTAVHVADAIASEADTSLLNHDATLDHEYLARLGLSDKEGAWRGLYQPSPAVSLNPGR